jgi:hypothetical protein
MLTTSTAGIETVQDRAKLVVSGLEGNLPGLAPTKKMGSEKARIGRNFGYQMATGHKRLPSNDAASGVRSHRLAIDEDIEVQRHGVDYQQIQLRSTGFLKRKIRRSALARSRIAHPNCKVVIRFHN